MAAGRMINRSIAKSHDVAALIDRVCEAMGPQHAAQAALLFTWCIPFQDVEGRMHGDPRIVRADVIPLLEHITAVDVGQYLGHMAAVGLVIWYRANARYWLAFPGFQAAQPSLRKDKESPSVIPSPDEGVIVTDGVTPELVRSKSVYGPGQVEEKRSRREVEVKGKERSATPKAPRVPTDAFKVVDAWKAGWVERFKPIGGRAPEPNDPDWKQVKNLLGAHGLEKTLQLVVRFLDDTDKMVAERGHMLRDLPSRIARYAKGDGPLFGGSHVGHAKPAPHNTETVEHDF